MKKTLSIVLAASLLLYAFVSAQISASAMPIQQDTSARTAIPQQMDGVASVQATFTVNTLSDSHDNNKGDGKCLDNAGQCSLRAALEEASALAGADTVTFDASLNNGVFKLTLGSLIFEGANTSVDATGRNLTISGEKLTDQGQHVVVFSGNNNTLKGVTIKKPPVNSQTVLFQNKDTGGGASGNTLQGVMVYGAVSSTAVRITSLPYGGTDGTNNKILDSFIGTSDPNATSCNSSGQVENNNIGIMLEFGASGTIIQNNVIVCSNQDGIDNQGSGGVVIKGNRIGVNNNGTAALPNGGNGITLRNGATGVQIKDNVISGNGGNGIYLIEGATATLIQRNKIGTNAAGDAAIPNGLDGVFMTQGSNGNVVGGDAEGDGNVISGNGRNGVQNEGDTSQANKISGNLIGLNAAGTAAVGNAEHGVYLLRARTINVGTTTGSVKQYISGNGKSGVYITSLDAIPKGTNDRLWCPRNYVHPNNYIGVGIHGEAVGNRDNGITLNPGRCQQILPNLIAYNGKAGIGVIHNFSLKNWLYPLEIRDNGNVPIDLGNDGFTVNGSRTGTGPHNWVQYPTNGTASISGNTASGHGEPYYIAFIYEAIGDPTKAGGGGKLVAGDITKRGDAAGNWSVTLPRAYDPGQITMVGKADNGSFSEFGPRFGVYTPTITPTPAPGTPTSTPAPGTATFTPTPTPSNGKQNQSITFNSLASRVYGSAPFSVTASSSSGLAVTFDSSTPDICGVEDNTVTIMSAGKCSIIATQEGSGTFNAATEVERSFAIFKADQNLSFEILTDKLFSATPFPLSAFASSDLTVTLSSVTPITCKVVNSTVAVLNVGVCTVIASQGGDANYNPAASLSRSFNVTKGSQTIEFAPIADVSIKKSWIVISPTASSGLTVTLSAEPIAVCEADPNFPSTGVRLYGWGVCTVTASQPGNNNYTAAPSVSRSFKVLPPGVLYMPLISQTQ